jgi:hypothetical protein
MSALPILEVAVGLSFMYLLLALMITTITEWITRVANSRGTALVQGISQLLGEGPKGGTLTTAILDHPLIRPLGQQKQGDRQRAPSYIPATLFSHALADVLTQPVSSAVQATENATESAKPTSQLKVALRALAPTFSQKLTPDSSHSGVTGEVPFNFLSVEQWYDDHMERVSGWYKRHTQTIVLVLAVMITLITNTSTISVAQRLWTDAPLRETVVETAKVRLQQGPPLQTVEYEDPTTPKPTKPVGPSDHTNQVLPEDRQLLDRMVGWSGEQANFEREQGWWVASHLLGWLLTALAISLGAPFWFDTLNKLASIRSAGRSPQEAAVKK